MIIKWRDIETEKPAPFQQCLTKMKHGIIEGTRLEDEDSFEGYYFRNLQWGTRWRVPIEEV